MKKMIKHFNYFGFALALCVMIISGCGCNTTKQDPLAGFHVGDLRTLDSNKVITDDYKDYVQKLSPEEKNYMGPIFYFEDGKGQCAVKFEIDKYGEDVWDHYLFYDKNDKRIKVEKIHRGRYWNP